MPKTHHPQRGSHGYSPRKRAAKPVPRQRSWPEDGDEVQLQGFAGYKAGMTHVLMTDYRPTSTTSGQEVVVPVTVIEAPPIRVAAVRVYKDTPYGLESDTESWASELDPELARRVALPSKRSNDITGLEPETVDDVRVLAYTQPRLVAPLSRKAPHLMEVRVGGPDVPSKLEYADGLLGTEITVDSFVQPGQMLDVTAITKGKGLQGAVKRWGIKIQSHKSSKPRRKAAPLGPFRPPYIRGTVPMPGQVGYHQRTEYNKRVLKMGDDGSEITPKGGFVKYGEVDNPYLMVHGSLPGPSKRLVRLRHAIRYHAGVEVEDVQLTHISTTSHQGA